MKSTRKSQSSRILVVRKYTENEKETSASTLSVSRSRAVSGYLVPCCRRCESFPEARCASPEPLSSLAHPLGSQISSALTPTHTLLHWTVGEGGNGDVSWQNLIVLSVIFTKLPLHLFYILPPQKKFLCSNPQFPLSLLLQP